MKRIIFYITVLVATAAAVGCSKTKPETNPNKGDGVIRVVADVPDTPAASRVAFGGNDAIKGLRFMRVDATTKPQPGSYYDALFSGDRTDDATNVTFDTPQYYHPTKNTYVMGFYPVETAEFEDKTYAIWPSINGKVDYMCTEVYDVGTLNNPIVPVMRFKHILFQLEIVCVAQAGQTDEVRARWGKIEYIKAQTQISAGVQAFVSTIAFGTLSVVSLSKPNYTDDFVSTDIQASDNTAVTCAAMIPPPYDNGETVTLRIKMSKHAEFEQKVTLGAGKTFKAGEKHVITLVFNQRNITVKSSIEPWSKGGSGVLEVK